MKRETTATGGDAADEDDAPSPINPNEDYLDARGIAFQNSTSADENVQAYRDASDRMMFQDGENTTAVSLTQLLGLDFTNYIFDEGGGFVYTDDMVPVTRN